MHVVFFDLGDTLGTPRFASGSSRLRGFDPFPNVPRALASLRLDGPRLGVISNTPDGESQDSMRRVLEGAGIYAYFDESLLIYSSVVGHKKDSPEVFILAVVRAGLSASPGECLFVGEDPGERAFAAEAGMQALDPGWAVSAEIRLRQSEPFRRRPVRVIGW